MDIAYIISTPTTKHLQILPTSDVGRGISVTNPQSSTTGMKKRWKRRRRRMRRRRKRRRKNRRRSRRKG